VFFYAGARALLVAHWYVNSAATVDLITGAFDELKAHPEIRRAEAMRRAMSALIARGGQNAHPAFWAPFAVVGEGAR
jgi:CHAT domain-containing protein